MENQFFKGTFRKVLGLTILLWIICSLANATDVMVFPDMIIFDYDNTSFSSDALTVRNATGGVADIPEYYPFDSRNNPVAYIKNQANRKIWVRFGGNYQGTVHLLLKLSVSSGNGIGTICNLFIPNYDISSGNYTELQLAGYLPNWVGKHTFTWKWEIYAIPVNTSSYCAAWNTTYTTHTCYTVLAVPQAPMAKPWLSVLDYACVWANGHTTEADVVWIITQEAYNSLGKVYYPGNTHAPRPVFHLKSFLSSSWADCQDMSAVVQVFTNALGGSNIKVRSINYFSGQLVYKAILAIGNSVWSGGTWNFHQFGYLNNVYDACLMLKQSEPRIPLDESIDGSYKTDLFQSGTWNKDNAIVYTTVD